MKQLWKSQALGLLWFLIVYALIRLVLRQPAAAIQDAEILIIVGSALAFCWLTLAFIKESLSGLSASLNLSVTTIFFFFNWGYFGFLKAEIALGSLLIVSVIILGYELIKALQKEREAWFSVLVNAIVLLVFLFLIEKIIS